MKYRPQMESGFYPAEALEVQETSAANSPYLLASLAACSSDAGAGDHTATHNRVADSVELFSQTRVKGRPLPVDIPPER